MKYFRSARFYIKFPSQLVLITMITMRLNTFHSITMSHKLELRSMRAVLNH